MTNREMKGRLATAGRSGRKIHKGIERAHCNNGVLLSRNVTLGQVTEDRLCKVCFPGGVEQARDYYDYWQQNS